MCGIVGFTGNRQAAPILLDGLSKLEYRGYDSAGLAVRDGEALAQVVKAKGRLSNLIEKTDGGKALKGTCGIGHTRWATHGEPSQTNAHPHVSGNCSRSGSGAVESEVVGVHNGIIENYTELKEKLLKHGYTFYSQTDTEVVIKLVDYYYKKYKLGPIDAIAKTMVRVRGSYALELMFRDYPGEIWVARKDSPMIIGIADGETYVASDVPAILKYGPVAERHLNEVPGLDGLAGLGDLAVDEDPACISHLIGYGAALDEPRNFQIFVQSHKDSNLDSRARPLTTGKTHASCSDLPGLPRAPLSGKTPPVGGGGTKVPKEEWLAPRSDD